MNTIKEVEEGMAGIILEQPYAKVIAEFNRLLTILGNVDGDEVIALVLLAYDNVQGLRG